MTPLPWRPRPRGPGDAPPTSPSPTGRATGFAAFLLRVVPLLLVLTLAPRTAIADGFALAGSAGETTAGTPDAGAPAARERSWHSSLETARAEAERDGKLLFVDLFAEWCGWCRVLDRNVFSQPVFDPLAEELVLVRLDVEDGAEGARTQAQYEVYGLPTTLILEPAGTLVGKVTGVAAPADYVRDIQRQIDGHRRALELYERVVASGEEAGDSEIPADQVLALAEDLHKRGDGARAAALYRRLEERGWSHPRGKALLPFRRADALRLAGRYEEATRSLARARELAIEQAAGKEDAELVETIDLLGVQIAYEQGDCAERRKALEGFLRQHPKGAHHQRVEHTLAALETGTDGAGCS